MYLRLKTKLFVTKRKNRKFADCNKASVANPAMYY